MDRDNFIGQIVQIGSLGYGEKKENAFVYDYQKLTFLHEYKNKEDYFVKDVARKSFNFFNVLGDFVADVVIYESDNQYTISLNHPFFMGYLFNGKKELTEEEKQTFKQKEVFPPKMLLDTDLIFETHKNLSKLLSAFENKVMPFEKIQSALNLSFTYTISKTDGKHVLEHFYTIDDICNGTDEKEEYNYIDFTYYCNSIMDIVFAVLHCCIFYGYKFKKCNHCGKYFATRNLKQKYCTRNSPYPNYEHLPCEQAVRNIVQQQSRKKKIIYNKMLNYNPLVNNDYNNEYNEKTNNFLIKCNEYRDEIKKCASIVNLQNYDNYLNEMKSGGGKNGNDNKEK